MKLYRCKHAVEAMRWTDTDTNREAFATWFEKHDTMFVTRGPEVVLPDFDGTVSEGEWILYSDGEFIVMEDELFTDDYELSGSSTSEKRVLTNPVVRLDYDDDQLHIVDEINSALKLHGLKLVDDDLPHAGFCLFTLQKDAVS